MNELPLWVETVASALLLLSGALSIVAAIGLVRMKTFFTRMHPPTLAGTLGAWCVALACILYFSAAERGLSLHTVLINVMIAITAPVSSVMLARAALFRKRQAGDDVPPALGKE